MADPFQLPNLTRVVLVLAAVYIAYATFQQIVLSWRRRAFMHAHGAKHAFKVPQWDPIFGIDRLRETRRLRASHTVLSSNDQRFSRLGTNTMSVRILGRTITVTSEPENLKAILATDFKKFGLRILRSDFKPLLGDGIFTTDGAQWQHSRNMLRPNFVKSQVGDLDSFERHVKHLVAAIPRDGSTVDLSELFFRLTIDSATEFLFGESTDSLTQSSEQGFALAFNRAQDFISTGSRRGNLLMWFLPQIFKDPHFAEDRAFVHQFVDHYVDKGLAKRSELLASKKGDDSDRYLFIDELVRQTDDREQIRFELLNILLAGRDTTASLLTNVWFVLSKRPDLWRSLQSEVSCLDGATPTYSQLRDLKFVRALLNESLRLHPVVPQNARQALEDVILPLGGGRDGSSPLYIPKGGIVSWSVYSMHRRQDFYGPDADEFRPERWLDDPVSGKKGLRVGWEYLPFNGGTRICLGQQYALTEASYVTVRLCQAFSRIVSRDESEHWTESMTLTCLNLTGAKVTLTARE